MVLLVEGQRAGIFNAVGPAEPLTMAAMPEACRPEDGVDMRLTWVDEEFLLENGVQPWTEMPLWIPEGDPANHLDWEIRRTGPSNVVPSGLSLEAGMSPERERLLLAAWDARRT